MTELPRVSHAGYSTAVILIRLGCSAPAQNSGVIEMSSVA